MRVFETMTANNLMDGTNLMDGKNLLDGRMLNRARERTAISRECRATSWYGRFSFRGLAILMTLAGLGMVTSVSAQDYQIRASDHVAAAATMVDVSITIDNVQPLRGFSFGLTHDPAVVSLLSITEGAASLATNGGLGADYLFFEPAPVGEVGGIVGIVISTAAPIEDIPVGAGQQVAVFQYQVIGAGGSTTSLDFVDTLGDPDVATVFSVAGVSHLPVKDSGSISVKPPAVQSLTCMIVDPCTCEATIGWVNGMIYDNVQVSVGGVIVANVLTGPATVTIPTGAPSDVCVTGQVGGLSADAVCCSLECLPPPGVAGPQNLICSVDPTCLATLTWNNGELYPEIRVYLDGILTSTLVGDATTTSVALPMPSISYDLCLEVDNSCGAPPQQTCCQATCGVGPDPQFVRGNCNGDSGYDIADAVFDLAFLFPTPGNMPTLLCEDACDCNDDGNLDIADAICILSGLFGAMTTPPPAPHPTCGSDPSTGDPLGCASFPPCGTP